MWFFVPAFAADPALLGFESADALGDAGWLSGPGRDDGLAGLSLSDEAHRGAHAVQLDATGRTFTAVTLQLPVDFDGDELEVRGWLRWRDVTGWAGLWQRQDGPDGMAAFDNMQDRPLTGTSGWREVRVSLPLVHRATSVSFGALLVGGGSVWLDDVSVLVDGQPVERAPARVVASSGLAALAPTDVQVANLALLGRVWGFVKYHHGRVTDGDVDIDAELFGALPSVLAAATPDEGRAAVDAWVASLGPPPPCRRCAEAPADPVLAAPNAWLSDRVLLGDALSSRLLAIEAAREDAPSQRYVSLLPRVHNPSFDEDDPYVGAVPDAGYRLLALFRYWNVIRYWSPNRDLVDGDWDAALDEFVPAFASAGTSEEYRQALIRIIGRTRDSHAQLWTGMSARPPLGRASVPVAVRHVEGRFVVFDAPYPEVGLRVGDVITAVDGVPVEELVAAWRPLFPGSNEAAILRDLADELTRGPAGPVTLSVERADGPAEVVTERAGPRKVARWHDHGGVQRLSPQVAYLALSDVDAGDVDDYLDTILGAELLVLDLRNYPSDFLVFDLGEHLVAERTTFAWFTAGDPANPGAFAWDDSATLIPDRPLFTGRVVILVDEVTQSSAEYHALAFRTALGALVFGSTTAGADGNVSAVPLPGGESTYISGIGVFTGDRAPTQRVGVPIDRVVTPTIAGIRAGRDEVLEAAVQEVLGRGLTDEERAALE